MCEAYWGVMRLSGGKQQVCGMLGNGGGDGVCSWCSGFGGCGGGGAVVMCVRVGLRCGLGGVLGGVLWVRWGWFGYGVGAGLGCVSVIFL